MRNSGNISSTNGIVTFDVSNSNSSSYKAYYHVDTPSWLWRSSYNSYDFTDGNSSSNCSSHPCFEYIFMTNSNQNSGVGIRSGTFGGASFKNDFNSTITKKAIKVMR